MAPIVIYDVKKEQQWTNLKLRFKNKVWLMTANVQVNSKPIKLYLVD